MALSSDLREFIGLLNSRRVEYLIVGAHSLAFHARPSFTGDRDILIRPSPLNAEKLIGALKELGFADLDVSVSDLTQPEQVLQLGRAPHRVDLLTSISGVSVDEAFGSKVAGKLDDVPVAFISKPLLIANKRAVARPQDLADRDELER
jgi:hypothetical protein